jgi:hypothetical protein
MRQTVECGGGGRTCRVERWAPSRSRRLAEVPRPRMPGAVSSMVRICGGFPYSERFWS